LGPKKHDEIKIGAGLSDTRKLSAQETMAPKGTNKQKVRFRTGGKESQKRGSHGENKKDSTHMGVDCPSVICRRGDKKNGGRLENGLPKEVHGGRSAMKPKKAAIDHGNK